MASFLELTGRAIAAAARLLRARPTGPPAGEDEMPELTADLAACLWLSDEHFAALRARLVRDQLRAEESLARAGELVEEFERGGRAA